MIRHSSHWLPDLKKLSSAFYVANVNGKCVDYRENNFPVVDACCDKRVDTLKREIYPHGLNNEQCLLDRHKIVATHVQCILGAPVFVVKNTPGRESVMDLLANEYLCYLTIHAIINSWPDHKKHNKRLRIPPEYRDCLLKLFYKYRTAGEWRRMDTTFSYALSNIVYFVEERFLA